MSDSFRHYAFQHVGLDRAEHLREDASALQRHWPRARLLIVDADGLAFFAGSEDAPEFLLGDHVPGGGPDAATFLGLDASGAAWFAVPAHSAMSLPPLSMDLRSAAARWPALQAAVFAQARALLHWQWRNRYCGACGHPLQFYRAGFAARCEHCASEHYPRTDPAIIVAVSDGERLLLGRQAGWPEKRYSVLAGFLEPGESLEQTVAREVMEEAGVRVTSCRYLGSQPWPFPASLMLGFTAEADPQPVRVGPELEDARWFSGPEIREQIATGQLRISPRLSISRWLIDDWLARH